MAYPVRSTLLQRRHDAGADAGERHRPQQRRLPGCIRDPRSPSNPRRYVRRDRSRWSPTPGTERHGSRPAGCTRWRIRCNATYDSPLATQETHPRPREPHPRSPRPPRTERALHLRPPRPLLTPRETRPQWPRPPRTRREPHPRRPRPPLTRRAPPRGPPSLRPRRNPRRSVAHSPRPSPTPRTPPRPGTAPASLRATPRGSPQRVREVLDPRPVPPDALVGVRGQAQQQRPPPRRRAPRASTAP